MSTVILDNYDSFTFNLFQLVADLEGEAPLVFRNDGITLDELRELAPRRIVISPGPGTPGDPAWFGVCDAVIRDLGRIVPILGVCLGHLGIVEACGGRTRRSPAPRHGKSSPIHHTGTGIFAGLPDPLEAMRYHSLIAERDSLPDSLELTAWTAEGLVMGVRHRERPLVGVQFHPESIGTPQGREMVGAFLRGDF